MDADITALLAALAAKLKDMFPGVTVMVKAKGATDTGKAPAPGWTKGNPLPCFVISELHAEGIDQTAPAFGFYSVDAPVAIEYVKSAAPKSWVDDKEVRLKRQQLADTLYTGVPGQNVPNMPANVWAVRLEMLPVYAATEDEDAVASGLVLTYTLTRDRG